MQVLAPPLMWRPALSSCFTCYPVVVWMCVSVCVCVCVCGGGGGGSIHIPALTHHFHTYLPGWIFVKTWLWLYRFEKANHPIFIWMLNRTNDEYDKIAAPLQMVEPAKVYLCKLNSKLFLISLNSHLWYSVFRILDSTTSTARRSGINQASLANAFSLCSACHHILMVMKYLIWNQESPNMCFCCYLNKSLIINLHFRRSVFKYL